MKALLLAALLAAVASPAGAEGPAPDATAQAKARFKRGSELYREARYREAIAEFDEANRLRPHGVIFYNLAQCHERIGDIPAALRAYHEYLRAVPDAEDRASVNAALANLGARLGASGVQQLLVHSDPEGAEVYVDGQPRGRTPFAGVFPHGAHRLSVLKPGYATVTREALLAADRSVEVDVALAPVPAPTALSTSTSTPTPTPTPNLTPTSTSTSTSNLTLNPNATPTLGSTATSPARPSHALSPRWKWIAAGAAAVALAAGGAYGLAARSASADLRATEHDGTTATRLAQSATSRARTANVLYGVGAAAGAAGLGLFVYEVAF
ncbi:MAG: PEGA domain-containing protein [Anaeromyxobacteraceae bacterium]